MCTYEYIAYVYMYIYICMYLSMCIYNTHIRMCTYMHIQKNLCLNMYISWASIRSFDHGSGDWGLVDLV